MMVKVSIFTVKGVLSKVFNIRLCLVLVDTKKTLCAYFKAGVCEKGKKCKYSHDMTIE